MSVRDPGNMEKRPNIHDREVSLGGEKMGLKLYLKRQQPITVQNL